MRKQYNLAIGEQTAEDVKKQIGACDPTKASPDKIMDIRGRDLVQGPVSYTHLPRTGTRVCHPFASGGGAAGKRNPRRNADPAQRMPSA